MEGNYLKGATYQDFIQPCSHVFEVLTFAFYLLASTCTTPKAGNQVVNFQGDSIAVRLVINKNWEIKSWSNVHSSHRFVRCQSMAGFQVCGRADISMSIFSCSKTSEFFSVVGVYRCVLT